MDDEGGGGGCWWWKVVWRSVGGPFGLRERERESNLLVVEFVVKLVVLLWSYLVATSWKAMWGWQELKLDSQPLIKLSQMGPTFIHFCLFTYCCRPPLT